MNLCFKVYSKLSDRRDCDFLAANSLPSLQSRLESGENLAGRAPFPWSSSEHARRCAPLIPPPPPAPLGLAGGTAARAAQACPRAGARRSAIRAFGAALAAVGSGRPMPLCYTLDTHMLSREEGRRGEEPFADSTFLRANHHDAQANPASRPGAAPGGRAGGGRLLRQRRCSSTR